jgi:hypothetical protein
MRSSCDHRDQYAHAREVLHWQVVSREAHCRRKTRAGADANVAVYFYWAPTDFRRPFACSPRWAAISAKCANTVVKVNRLDAVHQKYPGAAQENPYCSECG